MLVYQRVGFPVKPCERRRVHTVPRRQPTAAPGSDRGAGGRRHAAAAPGGADPATGGAEGELSKHQRYWKVLEKNYGCLKTDFMENFENRLWFNCWVEDITIGISI